MYLDFLTFSQSARFLFLFPMFFLSSLYMIYIHIYINLYIYIIYIYYISFSFNIFATERTVCLSLQLENLAIIVLGVVFL